jgi:hypothetical protein
VYGNVPPAPVTVTVEFPPLHAIIVADELAVNAVGCEILTDVVAVQPLASVTVYECTPAVTVNVPAPEYGNVPPDPVTVTVEFPPLHNIAVADELAVSKLGCEIFTEVFEVQPFASVTV